MIVHLEVLVPQGNVYLYWLYIIFQAHVWVTSLDNNLYHYIDCFLMTNLYLYARTDAARTEMTKSANKWVDVEVGYDEKDFDRRIGFRVERDNNKIKVKMLDKHSNILVDCEETVSDGILKCKVKEGWNFHRPIVPIVK